MYLVDQLFPECEVEIEGRQVSVPIYKRDATEYKVYFANRSYSSTTTSASRIVSILKVIMTRFLRLGEAAGTELPNLL